MGFIGERARSWYGIVQNPGEWIGRDFEVRTGGRIYRGPITNIRIENENLREASGMRYVHIDLEWCHWKSEHNPDALWQECSRTSFHVNVTREDDYKGANMNVGLDGGMDLYIWLCPGYRFLPEGDNLIRQAA